MADAPDLPAEELSDDSANHEQILKAVTAVVEKNAALDLTKLCPFPEAVVRIPLKDEALVERHYQRQPPFPTEKVAIVQRNIDELLSLGY
ncbi:hypothetical protein H4R20_004344 [Coemansia guatemalensis]|uniref:Uncharacterized protein n=1 Tax=Coemansia guatemalensis TaxID=2761395 RepID=A0A9W8HTH5_9FUNG|nr:hypothetical protein H4R20_004344 [Coemansia guatemalensis]